MSAEEDRKLAARGAMMFLQLRRLAEDGNPFAKDTLAAITTDGICEEGLATMAREVEEIGGTGLGLFVWGAIGGKVGDGSED